MRKILPTLALDVRRRLEVFRAYDGNLLLVAAKLRYPSELSAAAVIGRDVRTLCREARKSHAVIDGELEDLARVFSDVDPDSPASVFQQMKKARRQRG